jgi:hypothetical protein
MSDEKVPIPADGQGSPKVHSDGVSGDLHGRGGESGGGDYENPHTGKEERGEGGGFEGGQSERDYFGTGQLGGKKADPDQPGTVGQGGGSPSTPGGSDICSVNTDSGAPGKTADHQPRTVTAGGQTFEVVEESGVAEAEANGKVGTDASS